jgi:hypothetical protein
MTPIADLPRAKERTWLVGVVTLTALRVLVH